MRRYWPYVVAAPVVFLIGVALPLILILGTGGRAQSLPPATPAYAKSLQGLLDLARPKGEPRDFVQDCRVGRVGNEHFCTWVYKGECHAGFVQETPDNSTVPVRVGTAPVHPCLTKNVLAWLRKQK